MNNNYKKEIIINVSGLTKTYTEKSYCIEIFKNLNFKIFKGEILSIVGPSGSGKSTLLHILGGLDTQTSGKIEICGMHINNLSEKGKSTFRNNNIGFIYQFHHLLPEFNAVENVAIPLLISGLNMKEAIYRSDTILNIVGLQDRLYHNISDLSGGERQRIAIARALVTNPKCVLADEPTGNLDRDNTIKIYDLIFALRKRLNITFIIVTHDHNLTKHVDRVLMLQEGIINSKLE